MMNKQKNMFSVVLTFHEHVQHVPNEKCFWKNDTYLFNYNNVCRYERKKDAPAEIYKLAQCQLNPACGGFERMGVVNNL